LNILLEGNNINQSKKIVFNCKNNSKCIYHRINEERGKIGENLTARSRSDETTNFEIVISDGIQAEKILQAFKHLFALRGWQEKKDLF
jgi:hypothetical protein